jgi:microcompartment protein CcmL/EutN
MMSSPTTKRQGADYGGPALAMIEMSDISVGFATLDALVKEAHVVLVGAGTVQHGHWLVAFAGDVHPVELSFARAIERAGSTVLDAVLLPNAEPRIAPTLSLGTLRPPPAQRPEIAQGSTLGVIQTSTSPTILRCVDVALKGAEVELVELRAAEGLGGRALALVWGHQHWVEAAIELATAAFAKGRPEGCSAVVIPNADPEVERALRAGSRYFKEFRG